MDLKVITEADFLGDFTIVPASDDAFLFMSSVAESWDNSAIQVLQSPPGYALAPLLTTMPLGYDMAALYRSEDGSYTPIGLYCGETVAIHPDHKGHGLGTELIIAAAPHRPVPGKRTVSAAGLATLKKAWRVARSR